jgi:hypothetical protein
VSGYSEGDRVRVAIRTEGKILELMKEHGKDGALVRLIPIGEGIPMDIWVPLSDIEQA